MHVLSLTRPMEWRFSKRTSDVAVQPAKAGCSEQKSHRQRCCLIHPTMRKNFGHCGGMLVQVGHFFGGGWGGKQDFLGITLQRLEGLNSWFRPL